MPLISSESADEKGELSMNSDMTVNNATASSVTTLTTSQNRSWQHIRTSRVHKKRFYFNIEDAKKYVKFAPGRDENGPCIFMTLSENPYKDDEWIKICSAGNIYVPQKYGHPDVISIDQASDCENLYRLRQATQWQIENEIAQRNRMQPTGWFQKSSVITVRREDLEYLGGTNNAADTEYWSAEVLGERPGIILVACNKHPGDAWINRTRAIERRAFGVSRKYIHHVGLTRNTQLQCIRTSIMLCDKVRPCFYFLAPDCNDAVTGRVMSESLENIIYLDVKKEANEQLSTVREYMSHTKETSAFSEQINQVIEQIQADKEAVNKLLNTKEIQELIKGMKKKTSAAKSGKRGRKMA